MIAEKKNQTFIGNDFVQLLHLKKEYFLFLTAAILVMPFIEQLVSNGDLKASHFDLLRKWWILRPNIFLTIHIKTFEQY